MPRVFHVPSHLSYVEKLVGADFQPVASPTGRPLRIAELLSLEPWDFFDVLHLHTVELATVDELTRLVDRLASAGKRLVVTVHDLVPNIETELAAFKQKTMVATTNAAAVLTLTLRAARQIEAQFGVHAAAVPHGYAVVPALGAAAAGGHGHGLVVFGALRPNRDLLGLVRAWRRLPHGRSPLRVLLRSVGAADRERYAPDLAELEQVARAEPDLLIEMVPGVVPPAELIARCAKGSVLVLPYHHITHSGQLELARDLGLAAVAPDVPTVRAQLDETGGGAHPCVWFPPAALAEPEVLAAYLARADALGPTTRPERDDFWQYRREEHQRLLARHEAEYGSIMSKGRM